MDDIQPRYLIPADAAAFLGIEPRALMKLDGLAYCRVGPRTIRYDVVDLKKYRPRLPLPGDAAGLAKLIEDRIGQHPTTGFIYFMKCREILKIGYSVQPTVRREQLQAVIPFELTLLGFVPGGIPAEREIHASFATIRYGNLTEWFHHSPALLEAIQKITKTEAAYG